MNLQPYGQFMFDGLFERSFPFTMSLTSVVYVKYSALLHSAPLFVARSSATSAPAGAGGVSIVTKHSETKVVRGAVVPPIRTRVDGQKQEPWIHTDVPPEQPPLRVESAAICGRCACTSVTAWEMSLPLIANMGTVANGNELEDRTFIADNLEDRWVLPLVSSCTRSQMH